MEFELFFTLAFRGMDCIPWNLSEIPWNLIPQYLTGNPWNEK